MNDSLEEIKDNLVYDLGYQMQYPWFTSIDSNYCNVFTLPKGKRGVTLRYLCEDVFLESLGFGYVIISKDGRRAPQISPLYFSCGFFREHRRVPIDGALEHYNQDAEVVAIHFMRNEHGYLVWTVYTKEDPFNKNAVEL